MRLWLALAVAAQVGCGGDAGPLLTASPTHASQFGYVDVTFSGDVASLGEIEAVALAGVPAYNVRATATSLTVTIQGAADPGPVLLEITGSRGRVVRHGAFTYDAAPAGTPRLWAAFGASLTQGTQSLGIDEHTQTHGVTAFVARQAGVFLPLPIFAPDLAPPLQPADFDLDCEQKPGTGIDFNRLTDRITDPATGFFDLRLGRLAWQTQPHNFGIGGSKLVQTLRGGSGSVALLEHIVEEPDIDPGDAIGMVETSQIARLEALDPDVGLCSDLLANDTDPSVLEPDDLHPDKITPLAQLQPMLEEMMQRLGRLHGQYFIANIPSLTFVPNVVDLRKKRIAAGTDTEASFDAKAAQIDALTAQYNQALADAMAPYPNLHVVDFAGRVETVKKTGIDAGGEHLTAAKFGGLLSFDNLHFTDTGYANYANLFIERLNEVLGLTIAPVDVDAVHATDEASPAKLRSLGFTCLP